MKSTSWEKLPERGALPAMRALLLVLNFLGYRVVRALLIPIVAYFVLSGAKSRRASRDYLARLNRFAPSAPKPTWWQIYLHHLEFAIVLLDRALLWQGKNKGFHFVGEGKDILERPRKHGSLLVGAHFGSFDVLRVLTDDMQCRVNVVMYRAHALRINGFLEKLNPNANLRVLELNPGDVQGILTLKACFERGEHVAILADRFAPSTRQRPSKVSFLGAEAIFPESPWLIASIFNCEVLFVNAVRTGSRAYKITVEPLADRIVNNPDNLRAHIQEFAARLETLCLRYPKQWFNFYNFWGEDLKL